MEYREDIRESCEVPGALRMACRMAPVASKTNRLLQKQSFNQPLYASV